MERGSHSAEAGRILGNERVDLSESNFQTRSRIMETNKRGSLRNHD